MPNLCQSEVVVRQRQSHGHCAVLQRLDMYIAGKWTSLLRREPLTCMNQWIKTVSIRSETADEGLVHEVERHRWSDLVLS
jgi:hypothetical protein